ncbi:UNVERIFIED_CONTAM: Transposon Tf2-11 polyprotein [Sesamum latifolium]|uniref:Transposon Tf2-11 polyprotein n=1 Tax=Sesamum latifolium TaxID=2727402 RepID=A0AAW2SR65_9LAMI
MPRHSLGGALGSGLVQRAYYWLEMRDDVVTYVRTNLICQQDKTDHQKKAGLLQPLPIPKRPWESVSMDYISGLPKKDWVKLLDVAQLSFNARKSSSTNKSAFEIVTEQQPLFPHTLDSPQEADKKVCRSKLSLHRVQCKRPCEGEGPKPEIIEVIKGERTSIDVKNFGPLPIIKSIGTIAYKIELPSWWKIHNVFHVSHLKKYSTDKEGDACNQPSRPQLELTKTKEKGYNSEKNTWERVTNLKTFLFPVEAYHVLRKSPSQVGENAKGCPCTRHP